MRPLRPRCRRDLDTAEVKKKKRERKGENRLITGENVVPDRRGSFVTDRRVAYGPAISESRRCEDQGFVKDGWILDLVR